MMRANAARSSCAISNQICGRNPSSPVSQVLVPIGICTVVQYVWGLEAWHIWLAILVGHMTRSMLSVVRFRQGAWRNIEVEIEPVR